MNGGLGRRAGLEWLLAAVGAVVGVAGGAVLLSQVAGPTTAGRWLLVTGLVVAVGLGYVGVLLGGWVGPARLPGDSMGPATAVTLLRGGAYAAVAGFLLVPPADPLLRWAPGVCYGAGATLDAVDGWLARRSGTTSELGERLDLAFDTTGFLLAPLVGVAWGRLPVWYLSLSVARYAFRAGVWRRRRAGQPIHPLPASPLRRRLAALQMAVITVALLPVLPVSVVHPAATLALVPSLAVFVRDWVAVTRGPAAHER